MFVDFKFLKKLQENAKGIDKMIWLVQRTNGKKCVLKSSVNKDIAKEEFEIMKKLNHDNIVKVIQGLDFEHQGCKYFGIMMEHMTEGDLENFIHKKQLEQPKNWTENEALRLIIQLIAGLSYLHEQEIIHRDLKPSNIFLCEKKRLAIGDFGISDSLETTRMTRIAGTDDFLPPEAIEDSDQETLTFARDMWSCGVVVYMISFLQHPFAEPNRMRTMMNICEVNIRQTDSRYRKCDALIAMCLRKNKDERIENACLLAKNHLIEGLMYQLQNGVNISDISFSERTTDVVKNVNAKLKANVAQKDDEIIILRAELESLEKNNRNLETQFNRKCQGLEASKKSNQEKTAKIKALQNANSDLNAAVDYLVIQSVNYGIYAVDQGVPSIILTFTKMKDVDINYMNWRVICPSPETTGGQNWKLTIYNSEREIKFRAMAQNIDGMTGDVIDCDPHLDSTSTSNGAVVEFFYNPEATFIQWTIDFD